MAERKTPRRRGPRKKAEPQVKPGTLPKLTDPVVITGISGNLGRLLTKRLHADHSIIGIDKRPFDGKPKDVVHHRIDVRRRKAQDIFRRNKIKALIHLGMVHRPATGDKIHQEWNVGATFKLLEYCQRYKIPKVVLLSTAYAYGPQPSNSNFLTEDAPLGAGLEYPEMRALIEWDMFAQSFLWKHPEIETVILRPVHVLGANVRNAISRYLQLGHPPTLMGFDPMMQLLHEDDLIQAIFLAMEPGRRGVFNIDGPGALPLSAVLDTLGKSSIPVPHLLAEPLMKRLWKLGLIDFWPGDLPHLRYQCMVDGQRARDELGYRPMMDLKSTIQSIQ